MKYLAILFTLSLVVVAYGLTPINKDFRKPENITQEFDNLYDNVQPKQFTILTTTPTLSELQDGEIIIYRETNLSQIIWRDGEKRYFSTGIEF